MCRRFWHLLDFLKEIYWRETWRPVSHKQYQAYGTAQVDPSIGELYHNLQAQPGVLGIWYLECFLTRYSVFFRLNYVKYFAFPEVFGINGFLLKVYWYHRGTK